MVIEQKGRGRSTKRKGGATGVTMEKRAGASRDRAGGKRSHWGWGGTASYLTGSVRRQNKKKPTGNQQSLAEVGEKSPKSNGTGEGWPRDLGETPMGVKKRIVREKTGGGLEAPRGIRRERERAFILFMKKVKRRPEKKKRIKGGKGWGCH